MVTGQFRVAAIATALTGALVVSAVWLTSEVIGGDDSANAHDANYRTIMDKGAGI